MSDLQIPQYEGNPNVEEVRCLRTEFGDWECNVFTHGGRETLQVDEVRAQEDARLERDGTRIHVTPEGRDMVCEELYRQDGRYYLDTTRMESEEPFESILLCE